MGLFSKKPMVDVAALQVTIEQVGNWTGQSLNAAPTLISAGRGGKHTILCVDVTNGQTRGRFRADELVALCHGEAQLIETTDGSTELMFLTRAGQIPAGSIAEEALRGTLAGTVALLAAGESMNIIGTLDVGEQASLGAWARGLPQV